MGRIMISVLIVDDHQLFAEGLSGALQTLPDVRVLGVLADGSELAAAVSERAPDVILMDLEMQHVGGLEALTALRRPIPTIIVSMHSGPDRRDAANRAGVAAFLSKAAPLAELAAAIRAVAAGKRLMGLPESAQRELLAGYSQAPLDPGAAALTEREKEVLQLLAVGVSSTEELADRLYISQKTVKNHLASIFSKLAVADRTQAAIEAIRLGIARPK
jgi:DNA-binding NarL/FixJ family response regulator